jgi:hypothetical protein
MASKIAWKNKRSKDTANYAGKDGSAKRDQQKRDLYNRGLTDAPTEEAMNRYYKGHTKSKDSNGGGGSQDTTGSAITTGGVSPTNPGSYASGTNFTASGDFSKEASPSYGSGGSGSNFYDAATGGSSVAGNTRNPISGSGLPAAGLGSQGVQPGTKTFGAINPSQYQSDWQQQIYSPQNAEEAMYNQHADQGVASWDPLVQEAYIPAARGLANAFTMQQAGQGINGGQGLPGTDFRNYLGGLLSGQGGGIYGALQQAMQSLGGGSLVDMLKSGARMDPTGRTIHNPYLASLLPMLSDPSALLSFQQSLASPVYGNQLAGAQAQAGAIGSLRNRRAASTGNLAPGWDYITQLLMGGG